MRRDASSLRATNRWVFGFLSLESEIELIRYYDSETIAVTLNSKGCTPDELDRFRTEYRKKLGIPVVEPLTEGVGALVPAVRNFIEP